MNLQDKVNELFSAFKVISKPREEYCDNQDFNNRVYLLINNLLKVLTNCRDNFNPVFIIKDKKIIPFTVGLVFDYKFLVCSDETGNEFVINLLDVDKITLEKTDTPRVLKEVEIEFSGEINHVPNQENISPYGQVYSFKIEDDAYVLTMLEDDGKPIRERHGYAYVFNMAIRYLCSYNGMHINAMTIESKLEAIIKNVNKEIQEMVNV